MPGTVIIKPLEAKLDRNVNAFTKMDPYCVGMMGSLQLKGQVCKSGGQRPHWNEAMILRRNNEPVCYLEVKEGDLFKDSTIGVCEIHMDKLMQKGTMSKWFELFYKRVQVGTILLEVTYSEQDYPSRMVFYTKPTRPKPIDDVQPHQNKPNRTELVQKHLPSSGALSMNSKQSSAASGTGLGNVVVTNGLGPVTEKEIGARPASGRLDTREGPFIERPTTSQSYQGPETYSEPIKSQPPTKEKKGWFSKFKKAFDSNSKKNAPANPTNVENRENREVNIAEDYEPFQRRKPDANINKPAILERNVPGGFSQTEKPNTLLERGFEAEKPLARTLDVGSEGVQRPYSYENERKEEFGRSQYGREEVGYDKYDNRHVEGVNSYGRERERVERVEELGRGKYGKEVVEGLDSRYSVAVNDFDRQPRRNVVVSYGKSGNDGMIGGSKFNYR